MRGSGKRQGAGVGRDNGHNGCFHGIKGLKGIWKGSFFVY